MKLKLVLLSLLIMNAATSSAQLTMSQLTPGSPDYIYTKSLLNTHWNKEGKFEFTLPEDTTKAKKIEKPEDPTKALEKQWRDQLSKDEKDIVYGESVHRNEFGIDGGMFWSKDKQKLAFYRMDESMVQSYPLVQTDDREATVRWRKYPMAGMTSHQVTLGVWDSKTGKTIYLKTNEKPVKDDSRASLNDPEHYLTCVTWRPDGKEIFIAELNRKQNYMELNAYDAATGDYLHTIFTESSDKYVEPENPLYFLPGSNDLFIWQSRRDGYRHLYLYDLSKASDQIKPLQLTKGEWEVVELKGADPKNPKTIYFMATKEDPRERHLYRLTQGFKAIERITTEPGVHNVKISKDYTQVYDVYSNPTTPRVCQLIDLKSKKAKREVLYTAADPYEGYAKPEVEVGTLKSSDGKTDLYYRLVKPVGMNAQKKYPVVVYLYNGPHAQLLTEGYLHGLPGWDYYMAQQGFVVFTIDGRGSANRGLEFEQAIWHHLGEAESQDQLTGIEYVKSLPYVDAERIGIYGWSYGGFMTTYMKLNYPEIFKVGVCGGPVLDWSRYEVMYGERYMGTPQDNPEGYEKNCLIKQASELKGKLLIIHDDQDDTVVPQMSIQFLKNSVEVGTYPDFMLYPNHPHNVRGKDRVHLQTRIAQYFIDNL